MPGRVRIAAATFIMGSGTGPENERPAHRVDIDSFEIGLAPVTNAEYAAFVEASGHPAPPHWNEPGFDDPAHPVVAVSWLDAVAYCNWQSQVRGEPIRLPSEAEWEYAARGGIEQALYPWGDEPPQTRPGYATRWLHGPERVAQQAPNAFGVFDLCENVHEWCSDWYAADFYSRSPERNPRGPETGTRRASRGGSWRHQIKISRCAARSSLPPEMRYADYGFRIACDSRKE